MDVEDRLAAYEVLHLHGHLADAGAFERLDEVFTDDAVLDVRSLGAEPLVGTSAIRAAAAALGTATRWVTT